MSIQNIYNFYDGYLGTSKDKNKPNFVYSTTLAQKVDEVDSFWKSQGYFNEQQAKLFKDQGNSCAQNNDYKKAIEYYKKSIQAKPDYTDSYFNLAKTYNNIGDTSSAIDTYKQLLTIDPKDVEAITNLAECYKNTGDYPDSSNCYKQALNLDPKCDIAARSIKEINYLELKQVDPEKAREERDTYAKQNLTNALTLVMKYAPQQYTNDLYDVKFMFDSTDALGGHENIAQYEDDKRRIVVTDKYIWAAPEVIAAYLVHESVHAKDHDPYSSITEEQDAYREAVKFWIQHSDGLEDPEMDYATKLYKEDPKKLDEKVAEVYSTRDSSLPEYSPNHGSKGAVHMSVLNTIKGWMGLSSLDNSEPLTDTSLADHNLLEKYYK